LNARTIALLVVLTLAAGYVDAVAFFSLGVFTANMTGNTVLLGGALAARWIGNVPLAGGIGIGLPALSIAAFVVGALIAAWALRGETGRPPVRTIALLAGIVALLAVAAYLQHHGAAVVPIAIAALSVAMGLQSVVAVRAGVPGVSTTFVTGTLVTAVVRFEGLPEPQRPQAATNAAIWLCYLLGALSGTAALHFLGANALWIPAGVVALLTGMV
jgi:uncharacterized membrane protein YoaK (UPF0700 family)